jgi:hypothetical protein
MTNQSVGGSASDAAELRAILGRFTDARCVLECAVRSLEQWQNLDDTEGDRRACDPEIVCLRHALKLLADVYDEIDLAIARSHPRAGGDPGLDSRIRGNDER